MKYCPSCDIEYEGTGTFCSECGGRLQVPEPASLTTSLPAEPPAPGTTIPLEMQKKLGRSASVLWGTLAVTGLIITGGFYWLLSRTRPAADQASPSLISAPTEAAPAFSAAATPDIPALPGSALPDLQGDWKGSWGEFPATLKITNQSGDTFEGILTQQVSKGVFRIAVEGQVSSSTRSVTIRETRIIEERRPGEWGTLSQSSGTFAHDWQKMNGGGITQVNKIKWQWAFSR